MVANVLKFLFICLEVVVLFNLMIIVHELGHFLAARWRGLVIEKFGVWFGKPIWEKEIGGVVYSLGSIPAGGFVALPQLAPMEVMEGEVKSDRNQLPPISALDKVIVAFAGPLFSFLLACVFALAVWWVGRPVSEAETTTVIGYVLPDSGAQKDGLQPGDKIVSIDGIPVSRWHGMGNESVEWRIIRSEGEKVALELERMVGGHPQRLQVQTKPTVPTTKSWSRKGVRRLPILPAETAVVGEVGAGSSAAAAGLLVGDAVVEVNGVRILHPSQLGELLSANAGAPLRLGVDRQGQKLEVGPVSVLGALVGDVVKGLPAEAAGVQRGDRVLSVNGVALNSAQKVLEAIRAAGAVELNLELERAGAKQQVKVTPTPVEGEGRPMIGVQFDNDLGIAFTVGGRTALVHPGPVEQLYKAGMSIVDTVGAVASKKSDVKLQHMGGPVMMMRVYYSFFQMDFADGWRLAFWFSVVLNINLAMLNMLPIPVLDGGHIVLAIIEGIRRRPVSLRILEAVQTGCAVMIIGFMVYIFFFDVQDLFQGSGQKKLRPKAASSEAQK